MLALLATMAAAEADTSMSRLLLQEAAVSPADFRVPVSDSVRALSWDLMSIKPSAPTRVRVACIVIFPIGMPGACVSASRLKPGQTTVDWPALRKEEDADTSVTPADAQLREVVTLRLGAARLLPNRVGKLTFAIRVFDELVSPDDARPAFVPGDYLSQNDVTPAKLLDPDLMRGLFPVVALRFEVESRVTVTCKVEPNLALLCRDRGTVDMQPNDLGERAGPLRLEMLFATYQLLSTMKFEPTTKDGRGVVGRDVKFSVLWRMPK